MTALPLTFPLLCDIHCHFDAPCQSLTQHHTYCCRSNATLTTRWSDGWRWVNDIEKLRRYWKESKIMWEKEECGVRNQFSFICWAIFKTICCVVKYVSHGLSKTADFRLQETIQSYNRNIYNGCGKHLALRLTFQHKSDKVLHFIWYLDWDALKQSVTGLIEEFWGVVGYKMVALRLLCFHIQMGWAPTFHIWTDMVPIPVTWEWVPVINGTNFLVLCVCLCGNT